MGIVTETFMFCNYLNCTVEVSSYINILFFQRHKKFWH